MAIIITPDEDLAALESLIATSRAELARQRRALQLHRDILGSPAEHVTRLELDALKCAQAVEWLEAQRAAVQGGQDGS